jgi:L-lactate dehydrogenase complex protein LldF
MRSWRQRAFGHGLAGWKMRWGVKIWAFCARFPAFYRFEFNTKARVLAFLGRKRGAFRAMPFFSAWTAERDLPAPEGRTFMDRWAGSRND